MVEVCERRGNFSEKKAQAEIRHSRRRMADIRSLVAFNRRILDIGSTRAQTPFHL